MTGNNIFRKFQLCALYKVSSIYRALRVRLIKKYETKSQENKSRLNLENSGNDCYCLVQNNFSSLSYVNIALESYGRMRKKFVFRPEKVTRAVAIFISR